VGFGFFHSPKAFYENLGWHLDIDVAAGEFRGVQVTPHNSEASIIFGKGVRRQTAVRRTTWFLPSTTLPSPATT